MLLAASKRMLARLLVVTAAVAAVSCGTEDATPVFVIGAGDSVESGVLAEIYAGALARTGLPVSVSSRLGQRADYLAALDAGRVALVGEHSGELLSYLDSGSSARTPQQVTEALNRALPEGIVVADPAEGTDLRPRVLLPAEIADREDLRSVSELGPRCPQWEAALAPTPDILRSPSAPTTVAGCEFAATRALPDATALRTALLDGALPIGVLSGPLALTRATAEGLAVLTDEDYALPAENVLPVFRKGMLDDRRIKKLNYVAGELTTEELVDMILRVRGGTSPADVARDWLDAHAL
ncbi:glycine betaine ABC transporter substrate-binding protein [Nocardia sp. NPDC005366]|uniref:glycine betaine ABC transporter substrate-binding protein n=1 Tax=Nocardia sp. NPDC005366 TaxID=3156878 RepID=UPI0033BEBC96